MNKKSTVLTITLVLLVSVLIEVLVSINLKKKESSFKEKEDSSNTLQIKEKDMLSMMLETSYESGEYKMTTQSSWPTKGYVFNEVLSYCDNGSTISWNEEKNAVSYHGRLTDKCYVYFDKLPVYLANYVKELYTGTQGENNMYYHFDLTNGAGDNSYRYAGATASVNNYLCIEDSTSSTSSTCPDANLFRIIGVFNNQVKVIKVTSIGDMEWDSNNSNTWYSSSSQASLYTYLNVTYATSLQSAIGTTLYGKIANATWKVGGNTYAKIRNAVPAIAYTNEVTSPATADTVIAKIGLMYASDYGFAADPAAWTTTLYNYDGTVNGSTIKSLDWLYLGSDEWLVSRDSDSSGGAFYVNSNGYVGGNYGTNTNAVRPVFYLDSSVTYKSGSGTSSAPIKIG